MSIEINTENPVLMDLPMPIETERLILREPRFGDGKAVHAAKMESWETLNQWMPWAAKKSTLAEDEQVMRERHVKFLERQDLMMLIFDKETSELIGGTGLHRFDWTLRMFEIGFWIRDSKHGKGYATESTKALIRYAFDALDASKVSICHVTHNDRSRRVIEKSGFTFEGTRVKSDKLPAGGVHDYDWYYCLNADHLSDFHVKWGQE